MRDGKRDAKLVASQPRRRVRGELTSSQNRKFEDASVQRDMAHWPFKVVRASDGKPNVEVQFKGPCDGA